MAGIPTLLVGVFILLPTAASIVLSFTSWNGIGGLSAIKFIGLKNYSDLINVYQPFFPALKHNLTWLLFFLLIATPLGMFFAVLLDKNVRGTRIYQSALYMPVVLSLAIIGFIWQLIYAPEQGLLNNLLGRTAQGNQISWLGDPSLNLWAILVAAIWQMSGFVMVLYLAGLRAIPEELKEAARVDGCTEWKIFRHIVFPLLTPITLSAMIILGHISLKIYDLTVAMSGSGPGFSTDTPALFMWQTAFRDDYFGRGAAVAIIMLLLVAGVVVPYLVWNRRQEVEA